jgi:hypothetical protein
MTRHPLKRLKYKEHFNYLVRPVRKEAQEHIVFKMKAISSAADETGRDGI